MTGLTFRKKLWLPLVASLVCICALSLFHLIEQRQLRYAERRADLANIAELALRVVEGLGADAAAGRLAPAEARQRALRALKDMRYGDGGYIGLMGMDGHGIQNPSMPATDGKDMRGFADPDGVRVYAELAAIAASPAGAGFLHYRWQRAGGADPAPKLSRVVGYRPWGWAIVVGAYVDDIEAGFQRTLRIALAAIGAACALLAAIAVGINRSLLRTLGGSPEYAIAVARRIAARDLSQAVTLRAGDSGSLLHAMGVMQDRLAHMIGAIHDAADAIAGASTQIASGNRDLSTRTEQQAGSLEETAASMEQLTAAVAQNADNAAEVNRLALAASGVARGGGAAMADVVGTMDAIQASADRIGAIVATIDGIAFQTNILALNAAVEAARAGAQGRGFAVVAGEVRTLAQRSAAAAKEIEALIAASAHSIAAGGAKVERARATVDEVVRSVGGVASIIHAISTASEEQKAGILQVNGAIAEMDGATQQNAALVEQAVAAASSLADQATGLTAMVDRFQLGQATGR